MKIKAKVEDAEFNLDGTVPELSYLIKLLLEIPKVRDFLEVDEDDEEDNDPEELEYDCYSHTHAEPVKNWLKKRGLSYNETPGAFSGTVVRYRLNAEQLHELHETMKELGINRTIDI